VQNCERPLGGIVRVKIQMEVIDEAGATKTSQAILQSAINRSSNAPNNERRVGTDRNPARLLILPFAYALIEPVSEKGRVRRPGDLFAVDSLWYCVSVYGRIVATKIGLKNN